MEQFAKATKPRGQVFPEVRRSSDVHGRASLQSPSLRPQGLPSVQPQSPQHTYSMNDTPLLTVDKRQSDYFSSTYQQNTSFQLPEAAISSPPAVRAADWLDLQLFSHDKPSNIFPEPTSWTLFTDTQPWWGTIYTYQPCKMDSRVNSMKTLEQSPLFLFVLGTISFVNVLTILFLIIWFTPTIGLTCRHFPLFGISAAWLFSAAFTGATSFFCTGDYY